MHARDVRVSSAYKVKTKFGSFQTLSKTKKGGVFCFAISWLISELFAFSYYANYKSMTSSVVNEHWDKSQNEEYLWKEWFKIIETWRQYCPLTKTQDEVYCDVATATILAPVSFHFEANITICDSTMAEIRISLQHTKCPHCAIVPPWTIKERTMLVKPKKG